jgi:hypothetical protein
MQARKEVRQREDGRDRREKAAGQGVVLLPASRGLVAVPLHLLAAGHRDISKSLHALNVTTFPSLIGMHSFDSKTELLSFDSFCEKRESSSEQPQVLE